MIAGDEARENSGDWFQPLADHRLYTVRAVLWRVCSSVVRRPIMWDHEVVKLDTVLRAADHAMDTSSFLATIIAVTLINSNQK